MNAVFTDINVKLCVMQELMYSQHLLTPPFDVYQFSKAYRERTININEEGYDTIPEVLEYFARLPVAEDLLANVSAIYQDGGNDIYMQICPFWDGEDDRFNITSADDLLLLPNLKEVTLFYGDDKSMIEQIRSLGIKADYL